MAEQKLTLATLKGGALERWFQEELARVVRNIRDPNTSNKTKRTIKVELTFEPNEDRSVATIRATVGAKLAPNRPLTSFTLFEEHEENLVALEQIPNRGSDPRQRELAPVEQIRKPKESS